MSRLYETLYRPPATYRGTESLEDQLRRMRGEPPSNQTGYSKRLRRSVWFALAAFALAFALTSCGTQTCNGKTEICYDNCGICPDPPPAKGDHK